MDALGPDMAIPSHFKPAKPGMPSVINTGAIEFTRSYLEKLETVLARTTTPAEVIARMKALYPDLPGEDALETTAKVLKGESPWKVVQAFPPIARQIEVDFGGEYHFKLDFKDERTMTFRALKERGGGRLMTDTVQYTAIEIAPLVYLVYWTEADNTHVVQIQDYGQGVVWTNIAAPDSSFTNLKGTLKLLP
ncbi:MAG: hypothetical protein LBR52_00195 [Prevotellaceae bacterium]|nr:hypothetical protein [Prevotellaceae bacterium]